MAPNTRRAGITPESRPRANNTPAPANETLAYNAANTLATNTLVTNTQASTGTTSPTQPLIEEQLDAMIDEQFDEALQELEERAR